MDGSDFPSNETFGVTGLDGKGKYGLRRVDLGGERLARVLTDRVRALSWPFRSWASAATLLVGAGGRSPELRRRCTVSSAKKAPLRPGQLVNPVGDEDLTVSGSLWWSPSNWRNRITVPLGFAVPASACDVVSSKNSVLIYGSELMIQATGQWAPHFCLNPKLFSFTHVQTGEPEARNLLATGNSEAAFTSYPQPAGTADPSSTRPWPSRGFCHLLRHRRRQRAALHEAQAHAAALGEAVDGVLSSRAARAAGGPGIGAQPPQHHLGPGVHRPQPRDHQGRGRDEAASELIALVERLRRDRGAHHLHQRQPRSQGMAEREAGPVGNGRQPCLQGHQAAGRPLAAAVDSSSRRPITPRTTTTACTTARCPSCRSWPLPWRPRGHQRVDAVRRSPTRRPSARRSTAQSLGEKLVALGTQTVGYRFMIGITPTRGRLRATSCAPPHCRRPRTTSSPRRTLRCGRRQRLLKPDAEHRHLADPLPAAEHEHCRCRRLPRNHGRLRGRPDLRAAGTRAPRTTHLCCSSPQRPGSSPGSASGSFHPAICP